LPLKPVAGNWDNTLRTAMQEVFKSLKYQQRHKELIHSLAAACSAFAKLKTTRKWGFNKEKRELKNY
jgi:hypothetical protein